MREFIEGFLKRADEMDMTGPSPSQEDVLKFLNQHPDPTDDEVHDFSEEEGYNNHKTEQKIYELATNEAEDMAKSAFASGFMKKASIVSSIAKKAPKTLNYKAMTSAADEARKKALREGGSTLVYGKKGVEKSIAPSTQKPVQKSTPPKQRGGYSEMQYLRANYGKKIPDEAYRRL